MTREHLKPNKNTPNQTPEINKANQVGSNNKKKGEHQKGMETKDLSRTSCINLV